MRTSSLIAVVALVGGACSGQPESPSAVAGAFAAGPDLGFVHDNGFAGHYFFPETFGSGVALIDVNSDGDLDLYAVQGGPVPGSAEARSKAARPTNRLFLGSGGGQLRDATAQAGAAADAGFGMGVAAADVNGDGHLDLALTNVGPDRLVLGSGEEANLFTEATPAALSAEGLPSWSSSCGFADFDRDGHLDLVVLYYTRWRAEDHQDCAGPAGIDYCDVKLYPGTHDHVFRGDGRGGFEDHSKAWGFGLEPGRALGLALADFDDDGFVDIYVANDTDPNHYYHNAGGEGFTDKTALSGASANIDGRFEAGMGVAVGDASGDGLADILVTNFTSEPNDLYVNRGKNRFRERSRPAGIAAASVPKLAFGVTFQDFDLDGREDLFCACGHVQRHAEARSATWSWKQPDLFMLAIGDTKFEQRPAGAPFDEARVGRGLAAGDLDGDGRVDLAEGNSGDVLVIGMNQLEPRGAWLGVRLSQPATPARSNTAAIGAKLTLTLDAGPPQTRWVRSGTGYLSQDDLGQLFAIPTGRTAKNLEVRWPDGTTEDLRPGAPGSWMHVVRH